MDRSTCGSGKKMNDALIEIKHLLRILCDVGNRTLLPAADLAK